MKFSKLFFVILIFGTFSQAYSQTGCIKHAFGIEFLNADLKQWVPDSLLHKEQIIKFSFDNSLDLTGIYARQGKKGIWTELQNIPVEYEVDWERGNISQIFTDPNASSMLTLAIYAIVIINSRNFFFRFSRYTNSQSRML